VPALVAAAVAGTVLGALTEAAQGPLAGGAANVLVNSVGAWMALTWVVTAATGTLLLSWRRPGPVPVLGGGARAGAVIGLLAQEGLVVGYYGWAAAVSGTPHALASTAFWALAAAVGGPVAGLAAWCWRAGSGWVRAAGPALVGAVLVAEGGLRALGDPGAGLPEAAGGVLAVLLLLRGGDRWRALVLLVATAGAGAAFFPVANALVAVSGSLG
jgi:hypothetical protein